MNLATTTSKINKRLSSYILITFFYLIALSIQFQEGSHNANLIRSNNHQQIYVIYHINATLFMTITCKKSNIISISLSQRLDFQQQPRFNIYGQLKSPPKIQKQYYNDLSSCNVIVLTNQSSVFSIIRKDTYLQIFRLSDLSIKDQHNRFVIYDQSTKWGLGQRFQKNFQVTDGYWTIWNRDKPWKIDEGSWQRSDQTYGHQPIYLAREEESSNYHLSYFKNTHGLMIQSYEESNRLIFNSIGGNIHFVVIVGNKDPEKVLEIYHQYIGASHIPPFWSLGYHQSRWGYKTVSHIEKVLENFKHHDLPIDVIWTDLDYMKNKMIFTVDSLSYPEKVLNQLLQKYSIHYVPLLDVAISTKDDIGVRQGKNMDVFFKRPNDVNTLYTGQVWPGQVYYIDYLHPNSSNYWKNQLRRLYNKVKFSGIWLDMNEPTNFKGGEQIFEPFRIQKKDSINEMTINVNLRHFCQNTHNPLFHSEVHSYYGHLSAVPTYEFLSELGRPFIITRSNSVGTGSFAGHWTGDNVANWQFLRASINGNFLFQIFGIQMTGADICGFHEDTTNELCARWIQLGSFYPFARNHNHEAAIDQQPYKLDSIVLQTSKLCLKSRYALLKQMYSYLVKLKGKGSFFKPVAFQFYSDEYTFEKQIIQTEFMIGSSLLFAPIVENSDTYRVLYLPGEKQSWYEFQININYGTVIPEKICFFQKNGFYTRDNQLPSPPLTYLRSGHMLALNYPETRSSKLSNTFNLFAALKNGVSQGFIMGINDYNEQASIQKCISQGCFYKFKIIKISDEEGSSFILEWSYEGDVSVIGSIQIAEIALASEDTLYVFKQLININVPNGIQKLSQDYHFYRLDSQ